jgi:phosphatidate cytidylyltransferase
MDMTVTTLALLCAALLGIGYVLLAIFSVIPGTSNTARAAWPEIIIATLVYTIIIGALYVGGVILTLFFILMTFRVTYEAVKVGFTRNQDRSLDAIKEMAITLGIAVAICVYLASLLPFTFVAYTAPIVFLLALLLLFVRRGQSESTMNIALEIAAFPIIPLLVLVAAGTRPQYSALLLAAYMLVETFDSYALLGGKLFGRNLAFPLLSPRKTVEGLAIGALMLTLTAWLVGSYLMYLPLLLCVSLALLAGLLTIAGDLAASRLKRRSAVKDFPVVLSHQGGMLDITDAWISAGSGLVLISFISGYV